MHTQLSVHSTSYPLPPRTLGGTIGLTHFGIFLFIWAFRFHVSQKRVNRGGKGSHQSPMIYPSSFKRSHSLPLLLPQTFPSCSTSHVPTINHGGGAHFFLIPMWNSDLLGIPQSRLTPWGGECRPAIRSRPPRPVRAHRPAPNPPSIEPGEAKPRIYIFSSLSIFKLLKVIIPPFLFST